MQSTSQNIVQIIKRFPQKQLRFCFAYGSAIKRQLGYDDRSQAKTMIDCVFCVDDPLRWHRSNLQMNPSHYSGLKYFGCESVAKYQTNFGARVYFNTLIPWEGNSMIKYGVVAKEDLQNDLVNWTYLYLAGRLQKPVQTLHSTDFEIKESIRKNLQIAICTSLLMLPEKFTFYELFRTITSLSYNGDFRMIFGENKNKIHNIVASQMDEFHQLYAPALQSLNYCLNLPTVIDTQIHQDKSLKTILQHLQQLPNNVKNALIRRHGNGKNVDSEKVLVLLSTDHRMPKHVRNCIDWIVWNSSIFQSLKNIPSAGITKSVKYSWTKALKTFS